jgi:hypothetical protein
MDSKDREIKVLRDVLNSIIMIGFDYDGYENSLEGCKSLIDEFVEMSNEALNGRGITYLSNGKILNVFDEVVGDYDDETWELNYYDKDRKDY